ncbi:MAG: transcriptional repressor [Verrucomicrobia bacterium]|nr:transcriptional repressor [Verrucomicrobiota bacterium]
MKTAEQRKSWALQVCLQAKMRLTPIREKILAFLAVQHLPVSLEAVTQADGIQGSCDAATAYRTLMLFKEADIVRFVGSSRKESHFCLNGPDENNHFLICRECGRTVLLRVTPTALNEISAAVAASGFSLSRQDHEIHGVCNTCQQRRVREPLPNKLAAVAEGVPKVSASC